MSNPAVTKSSVPAISPRQPILAELWRNWRARNAVRKLQDRSDETLHDIGVTRDEIAWASDLPLSVNAAKELEKAAYDRRKAQRHMWL